MRIDAGPWLQHLDDARILALAGDAEGVHQVRVALRRLRVWLSFRGQRALGEELRWLCRTLALLRDLDVFGEVLTSEAREGLRPGAVAAGVAALESARWEVLREALNTVRPPRAAKAKRTLKRLTRQLERRRGALPSGDGEALHRLRRALRRVRYGREWLGLETAGLLAEQDWLGAVCDLLALQAFARRQHAEVPAQLTEAIARCFALLEEHR